MILEDERNTIYDYDENQVVPKTQPLVYGGLEFTQRMGILYPFWSSSSFDRLSLDDWQSRSYCVIHR